MTCYFRHLSQVFQKAGIEVTPENKKQVDKIIHTIVKTMYKDCPNTWREVKKRIANDENEFAMKLRTEWNNQQNQQG